MSKRYIHLREDLADQAALQAAADANPGSYPKGAQYVLADGAVVIVTANDGATVTLKPIPFV